MSKKRKLAGVEDAGFGGMDLSVNPERMQGHSAQLDKNGDHRKDLIWAVRPGRARASIAKFTGTVRDLLWFKSKDGVSRLFYFVNSTGKLEGAALPTNDWADEPLNVAGAGLTFNPITALVVSWAGGLTLTWTNPTSIHWVGTKILRRTDCYPQGPNDPAATTVYNGRLATATDSALTVGDTGYYCGYAYSKTTWSVPAKISGTRTPYLLWGGTGTGRWKAGP